MIIDPVEDLFWTAVAVQILAAIKQLAHENPTLGPDDIGIILLDANKNVYALADQLAISIPRELGWTVNKAHETKQRHLGQLFISNRNNVKGLEFPFVICVSEYLSSSYRYRNALYMTLTRSFIQSRLLVSGPVNADILPRLELGLAQINMEGVIEVSPPPDDEKARIKTTIRSHATTMSFFDMANQVFEEQGVIPLMQDDLFDAIKKVIGEDLDVENIRDTSKFVYQKMMRTRL